MSRRFPDGAVVRVRALFPPGHCRTPHYTRGRCGTVLGVADHQPNPEALAYGRDGLPRLVARAWVDTGFRERLLADVNLAALELGIDAGGIPIRAIANEPRTHNVIVCTLSSCYPRLLLGPSPDWYKARAYRSRVVREPRTVLAEFGLE